MYRTNFTDPPIKFSLWEKLGQWRETIRQNHMWRSYLAGFILGAVVVLPIAIAMMRGDQTPTVSEANRLAQQWMAAHHCQGTVTCYLQDRKRPIRYCDVVGDNYAQQLSCTRRGCTLDNRPRTP